MQGNVKFMQSLNFFHFRAISCGVQITGRNLSIRFHGSCVEHTMNRKGTVYGSEPQLKTDNTQTSLNGGFPLSHGVASPGTRPQGEGPGGKVGGNEGEMGHKGEEGVVMDDEMSTSACCNGVSTSANTSPG